MTAEELDYVRGLIDMEGFDYTFTDMGDFSDIEDEEFHRLHRAYVQAHNALDRYIGED